MRILRFAMLFIAILGCQSKLDKDSLKEAAEKMERREFVLYTAEWCEPCHRLKAAMHDDDMRRLLSPYTILYYDIDEHPEFHITQVPKYVVKHDGRVIKEGSGFSTKQKFMEWLKE